MREVNAVVDKIRVLEVATKLGGLGGTEKTLELFTRYMDRDRFEPAVYSWQGLGGPRSKMFDALDVPFHVDRDLGALIDEYLPAKLANPDQFLPGILVVDAQLDASLSDCDCRCRHAVR